MSGSASHERDQPVRSAHPERTGAPAAVFEEVDGKLVVRAVIDWREWHYAEDRVRGRLDDWLVHRGLRPTRWMPGDNEIVRGVAVALATLGWGFKDSTFGERSLFGALYNWQLMQWDEIEAAYAKAPPGKARPDETRGWRMPVAIDAPAF